MVATEPHPSKHMALHISNNFLVPYNDIHIVYNVPFNLKHLALSVCGKFITLYLQTIHDLSINAFCLPFCTCTQHLYTEHICTIWILRTSFSAWFYFCVSGYVYTAFCFVLSCNCLCIAKYTHVKICFLCSQLLTILLPQRTCTVFSRIKQLKVFQ